MKAIDSLPLILLTSIVRSVFSQNGSTAAVTNITTKSAMTGKDTTTQSATNNETGTKRKPVIIVDDGNNQYTMIYDPDAFTANTTPVERSGSKGIIGAIIGTILGGLAAGAVIMLILRQCLKNKPPEIEEEEKLLPKKKASELIKDKKEGATTTQQANEQPTSENQPGAGILRNANLPTASPPEADKKTTKEGRTPPAVGLIQILNMQPEGQVTEDKKMELDQKPTVAPAANQQAATAPEAKKPAEADKKAIVEPAVNQPVATPPAAAKQTTPEAMPSAAPAANQPAATNQPTANPPEANKTDNKPTIQFFINQPQPASSEAKKQTAPDNKPVTAPVTDPQKAPPPEANKQTAPDNKPVTAPVTDPQKAPPPEANKQTAPDNKPVTAPVPGAQAATKVEKRRSGSHVNIAKHNATTYRESMTQMALADKPVWLAIIKEQITSQSKQGMSRSQANVPGTTRISKTPSKRKVESLERTPLKGEIKGSKVDLKTTSKFN